LKATVNEYHVESGLLLVARGCGLFALLPERHPVVQILEPARAQNGLPQPLQSEREQKRADDESQRADRDLTQRRPERCHENGQHRGGCTDSDQRRTRTSYDSYSEHDRQCLHHLHRTGEKGAYDDQGGAGAHGVTHFAGTSSQRRDRSVGVELAGWRAHAVLREVVGERRQPGRREPRLRSRTRPRSQDHVAPLRRPRRRLRSPSPRDGGIVVSVL
jgi:hypothetical protein